MLAIRKENGFYFFIFCFWGGGVGRERDNYKEKVLSFKSLSDGVTEKLHTFLRKPCTHFNLAEKVTEKMANMMWTYPQKTMSREVPLNL